MDSVPVVIVPYDATWPARYKQEQQQILTMAGQWIVAVEHVGSTAVPGLAAKPIVDVMAGVQHLADAAYCIPRLAPLGYEYEPAFEAAIPERRFFRKGAPEARTCHLHLVELNSDFWVRHLLFRDYLRAHTDAANEYCQLKRELAARFGADRASYSDAKTDFVRDIEARAAAEADLSPSPSPGEVGRGADNLSPSPAHRAAARSPIRRGGPGG